MRTYQHIIDTKAVKHTLNSIPDHWVVRDLSERDYGIDLMVEIFSESGADIHGHKTYEATGRVCYLQVKGTNQSLKKNKNNTVSFEIDKKALLYVDKFATPFILVRVFTQDKKKSTYFVWLQRYIINVLEISTPDWRESKQENITIQIPLKNKLPGKSKKIEKIAGRIKYIEEHAEFYELYKFMNLAYIEMIKGTYDEDQYISFINMLRRIMNLSTLLEFNNCQVNKSEIETLMQYIIRAKNGKETPHSLKDFPFPIIDHLELLINDNFMRMAAEDVIAENDKDTVY